VRSLFGGGHGFSAPRGCGVIAKMATLKPSRMSNMSFLSCMSCQLACLVVGGKIGAEVRLGDTGGEGPSPDCESCGDDGRLVDVEANPVAWPPLASFIPSSWYLWPTVDPESTSGGTVRAKRPWGDRATFLQCFSSSDHTFGGCGPGSYPSKRVGEDLEVDSSCNGCGFFGKILTRN